MLSEKHSDDESIFFAPCLLDKRSCRYIEQIGPKSFFIIQKSVSVCLCVCVCVCVCVCKICMCGYGSTPKDVYQGRCNIEYFASYFYYGPWNKMP